MPPRGFNIGRGMKVNKEEILGMYVALEQYIKRDHDKEWKEWEKRISHIENAVKSVSGVSTRIHVPKLGNVTPTLAVSWNESNIKLTGKELQQNLRNGDPSIEVAGGTEKSINITVWVMKPGQEKIVAQRLREELSRTSA
jgi:L-seryl-tRNA(Ser) seleniumtransferase